MLPAVDHSRNGAYAEPAQNPFAGSPVSAAQGGTGGSDVIDTHCHLLPGLDDGPRSLGEALALARELHQHGVRGVVCTPHWSRRFPTTWEATVSAAEAMREALERETIPLALVASAETSDVYAATRPFAELRERSACGTALTVEMTAHSLPAAFGAIVSRLRSVEIATVIAHPERCHAVQVDPAVLDPLRAEGALTQVVASSLVSTRERVVRTAWSLLRSGRVDLLASDAHDVRARPSKLRAIEVAVSNELGTDLWRRLTWTTPSRLLPFLADAVGRRPEGSAGIR